METIDVAFSFDTTGSMSACIGQVRRGIEKTVKELFTEIPNIRIAIMAHGDYCDGRDILNILDFTDNQQAICNFVRNVTDTHGGDADEAYEFVLNRARTLSWSSKNNKALVMIGDCNPHKVGYKFGSITNTLDWRNEAELLQQAGVNIYPIQALNRSNATNFYRSLAAISDTPRLELNQFSEIADYLKALCYQRAGKLSLFEKKLDKRGAVSYNVTTAIDKLAGRKTKARKTNALSKFAVDPSRFQVLNVDRDVSIKDFVVENGLTFKVGRGFYEFTKTVTIQNYKEVIVQDVKTGDMFSGDKAREILNIPVGETARVHPPLSSKYIGFVQSTSNNRKLLNGTKFLYEVDYSR